MVLGKTWYRVVPARYQVRQFLGRPASSAGVERMFSKAGKLYDDAKKGQNDETLEAALFAAAKSRQL